MQNGAPRAKKAPAPAALKKDASMNANGRNRSPDPSSPISPSSAKPMAAPIASRAGSTASRAKSPQATDAPVPASLARSKSPSPPSTSSGPTSSARAKVAAFKAKQAKTAKPKPVVAPLTPPSEPEVVAKHIMPEEINDAVTVAFQQLIEHQTQAAHIQDVEEVTSSSLHNVTSNDDNLVMSFVDEAPSQPNSVSDAAVDALVEADHAQVESDVVYVDKGLRSQFAAAEFAHDFSVVAKTIAEVAVEIQMEPTHELPFEDLQPEEPSKLHVETASADETVLLIDSPISIDNAGKPLQVSAPATGSLLWSITRRVVSLSAPTIATVARLVEPTIRTLQTVNPRVQAIVKYAVLLAISPVLIGAFLFTWPFVVGYRTAPSSFKLRIKGALSAILDEYKVVRGDRLSVTA